jgi:hypothetical protein
VLGVLVGFDGRYMAPGFAGEIHILRELVEGFAIFDVPWD